MIEALAAFDDFNRQLQDGSVELSQEEIDDLVSRIEACLPPHMTLRRLK